MKATKVQYSKLVNLGNYNNERYEVELLVEEGEHIQEVFNQARGVVEIAIAAREQEEEERHRLEEEARLAKKREWAGGVMANPAAWDTWEVREAAQLLGVPNPYDTAAQREEMPF